jgi:membrane protease YdiL (CAAX protease family)
MGALSANLATLTPFLLLLAAVLALWVPVRHLWAGLLGAAVVAGYFTGALQGLAALWLALFAGLTLAFRHSTALAPSARLVLGLALAVFSVVLGLALLPGFPRTVVVEATTLTPGALPYSLSLGFPKVVAGVLMFALLIPERVRSWRELAWVLGRAAPVFGAAAAVVMVLTLVLGYVRFDPKWTPLFFLWAPANLFFTCLSEEVFFRGFVLRELAQIGRHRELAAVTALVVSSVLFGAVHLAGGWKYALAATLAGAGYGWAYLRTQRVEAGMAVHFALNATHFLLFTYPAVK